MKFSPHKHCVDKKKKHLKKGNQIIFYEVTSLLTLIFLGYFQVKFTLKR